MRYFLNRLREPSTWRGLILFVTGFGITLSPEIATNIVAAGTGIAGLVGIMTSDDNNPPGV